MIVTDSQLKEVLVELEGIDRIAVDTEADSLHCYYEKLCLIQLSFAGKDYLVDPLAGLDLAPLAAALATKRLCSKELISICVFCDEASIMSQPGSLIR